MQVIREISEGYQEVLVEAEEEIIQQLRVDQLHPDLEEIQEALAGLQRVIMLAVEEVQELLVVMVLLQILAVMEEMVLQLQPTHQRS